MALFNKFMINIGCMEGMQHEGDPDLGEHKDTLKALIFWAEFY